MINTVIGTYTFEYKVDSKEVDVKISSVIVLIAGLLVAVGLTAFADNEFAFWEVDVDATGATSLLERVETPYVVDLESIFNNGTLDYAKDVAVAWYPPNDQWDFNNYDVSETKSITASGRTTFEECAIVGGADWTGGFPPVSTPTGFVHERIENAGNLEIEKVVRSVSGWSLVESKEIKGDGLSSIDKVVGSWTVDPAYPTELVFAQVTFDTAMVHFDDFYQHGDLEGTEAMQPTWKQAENWCEAARKGDYVFGAYPDAVGDPNTRGGTIDTYGSYIFTNEPFEYEQLVGINP